VTGRPTAVDTSVAVPLLAASHPAHDAVTEALAGRDLRLTAHSLAETYSVLTRLGGDRRVEPVDAALLIDVRFGPTLALPESSAVAAHLILSAAGLAGSAVYDALVALAAKLNDAVLVTRDQRAFGTYTALDAEYEVIAEQPYQP
jgi:predicted nucleic acid-binding protein